MATKIVILSLIFNGGRVSKIFTVFLWLVILVLCDIF